MKILVAFRCADIYKEFTTLGCHKRYAAALCGCDKTTPYVRGLKNRKKNQKILLYVSINKVICTKYIVESTWYLCMSRCGRKRTSERSKTSIKDFRYKNSECANQRGLQGVGGGGGRDWERRGLKPRNNALTTCKAFTLPGSQRVIAVFFPQ